MTIWTRIAAAKSHPKIPNIINTIKEILEARYGPVHNMEMIRNFVGRFSNDIERAHFAGKLEKLKTFENVGKSVIDRAKVLGYLLVPEGAKPLPLGSRPPTNKDKRNNWNFFEVVTPSASGSGKELANLALPPIHI